MPLTNESGSDPDPAIFVFDQKKQKKYDFYFLKVHQGFSYYFCLMIEGSGSGAWSISGSVPLTIGSGSRRPKNIPYGSDWSGSATLVKSKTAHQSWHFFIRLCYCRGPPATWSLSWKQKGRGRGRSTSRGRRIRTESRRSSSISNTVPKHNPSSWELNRALMCQISVQYRALYGRWSIFFIESLQFFTRFSRLYRTAPCPEGYSSWLFCFSLSIIGFHLMSKAFFS